MKKPKATAPVAAEAPRKGMKISPALLDRASRPVVPVEAVWQVPQPLPGVVPDGVATMAQDDNLGGLYGYAGGSLPFGQYGGVNGFPAFPGYPYLAILCQQPEYRRGAETLAREMTRKWIKLTATGDDADAKADKLKQLEAGMKRHKLAAKFRRAAELDGFFGRGHIYIDTGASDDLKKTPLTIDKRTVKKGGLNGFTVVEPIWTYPAAYNSNDPLAADYYKPQSWYVQGNLVHRSRLLTFVSREVPDILKPAYMFGGVSLNQLARPYVDNWTRTQRSVGNLLHSFATMKLSTSMADALDGGTGGDIAGRVQLYNLYRDNGGVFILDKEAEDLDCVAVPLGTLDHLQAQAQEQQASVFGIPLTIMLGITPSGLNAGTDGEFRMFYDRIRSDQEHLFDDNLTLALEVLQLDLFGEVDEEIGFEWVSLWEMDEKQKADLRKSDADMFGGLIDAGVVSNAEVREVYANAPESPFAGLDLTGPPPEPQMDDTMLEETGGAKTPGEPAASESDGPR